jgi:branched-chain amino acid transport system ATP-binding protein
LPALEVRNVTKAYGAFRALNGANLCVEAGEIRALIGPNGAGKSTLIDVISGRARNWTGEVLLFGQDIGHLSAAKRRLLGLSRSFQRTSVFQNLTVRQQLALAAERVGDAECDSILEEFGLAGLADTIAGDIAYGDQRRLDLALALVGRPRVLLLDEPAAGLTLDESKRLAEHLRVLARRWSVTIVLVEHDMEVVFSIADRVTVLQLGAVLSEGLPDEIRRDRAVVEAYLGSAA